MSLTSLGIASDGLLDRGAAPALHLAVRGFLRPAEVNGGGGSGEGRYRRNRKSFGPGAYLNLTLALSERAKAVKAALESDKELRAHVSLAVDAAKEELNATPITDAQMTRSPAFNRLAARQIEASPVSIPADIPIDEILRWYEWLAHLERLRDEEDIALLLLLM